MDLQRDYYRPFRTFKANTDTAGAKSEAFRNEYSLHDDLSIKEQILIMPFCLLVAGLALCN